MGAFRKLRLLESDKGSLYNQASWMEEYEYDKGLYYNNYGAEFDEESGESDNDFDSEKDRADRNIKNYVTSERNVIVSINTLQSLITSANRCKHVMNRFALLRIEKSCWISLFAKNRMFESKQTDNNPTMPMTKRWIFL